MTTITIDCLTCGTRFEWTEQEQRDFLRRGWLRPKRCDRCKELMRRERERVRIEREHLGAGAEAEGADAVNAFADFDARRRR